MNIDYLVVSSGYDGRVTTSWVQKRRDTINEIMEGWAYAPGCVEEEKESEYENDQQLPFAVRLARRGLLGIVANKGTYGGDLPVSNSFKQFIESATDEKIVFNIEKENPTVKELVKELDLTSALIFQKTGKETLRILSYIFRFGYCGFFDFDSAYSMTIHTLQVQGETKYVMFVETDSESG